MLCIARVSGLNKETFSIDQPGVQFQLNLSHCIFQHNSNFCIEWENMANEIGGIDLDYKFVLIMTSYRPAELLKTTRCLLPLAVGKTWI